MEINSSDETPQEKVKTIFIDTKEQNKVNTKKVMTLNISLIIKIESK